jgi:hypothetical protein
VLSQLYTVKQGQYPWYDYSAVSEINSIVQYWASIFAQSATLVSEAMSYLSDQYSWSMTQTWVNKTMAPQGTAILQSAPSAVERGQVVDPQTGMIYKLAPAQVNGATNSYSNSTQTTTCSTIDKSVVGTVLAGVSLVPSSTVQGWWTAAQPTGWTVSTTSAFPLLQQTRSVGSQTQNALRTLAAGDLNAWAMVTADSVPYAAGTASPYYYDNVLRGYTYAFDGYLWCGENTVSLVGLVNNPTKWTENFLVATSSNVPSGVEVAASTSMPMGVLVQQQGSFASAVPDYS